jgi:hypothetical protein
MLLLLANSVAILNRHTRLARLETDNTFLLAALGAALDPLHLHDYSIQDNHRTPNAVFEIRLGGYASKKTQATNLNCSFARKMTPSTKA